MFATIMQILTLAYAVFLIGLCAYKTPQALRSRRLRKRIRPWIS